MAAGSFTEKVKAELADVHVMTRCCAIAQVMALQEYGCTAGPGGDTLARLQKEFDISERAAFDAARLKGRCCKSAFLRGAFLASGYCADGQTAGHLEFSAKGAVDTSVLRDTAAALGVVGGVVRRGGRGALYFKGGEGIGAVLALMGANRAYMAYENERITKDVNNNINRAANCEAANADKLAGASVRQIEDIKRIEAIAGLASLPEKLRLAAVLRLENPEMPLSQIAAKLPGGVSKSGANHRFKRIAQIAAGLAEDFP